MKGSKAVEGARARTKNRPSNKSGKEVESTEFTNGEKSWGDWGNEPPRTEEEPEQTPAS